MSDKELKRHFAEETNRVYLGTGRRLKYEDLLKSWEYVAFLVRLERKNDIHTVSHTIFDFSEITIRQLIRDGYKEVKEQMKGVIQRVKTEFR